MRRGRGFTLVEVLIAAGLLGVFAVVAAGPVRRAAMATTLAADRAAAVYYTMAGIEWARGCTVSELSGTGYGGTHNFPDTTRGITFRRTTSRTGIEPRISGAYVIWRVTSTTAPFLTGPLNESPSRTVRRLGGIASSVSTDVKIVSYACQWLLPTSDQTTSN